MQPLDRSNVENFLFNGLKEMIIWSALKFNSINGCSLKFTFTKYVSTCFKDTIEF